MRIREPLVSIIIPMYNCQSFIQETLESVLTQTFKNFEVIAIDDGSNDATAQIVQQIARNDERIIYVWQENAGVSAARNKAIKMSRAKFIAFLDHDDIWLPTKLEEQIPLFNNNSRTGLVFSNAIYFNEDGTNFYLYREKPPTGRIFRNFLVNSFLCISTVVIRKEAFLKLGEWFNESLYIGEDLDVFLRILYNWDAQYRDAILVKYRLHKDSYTFKNREGIPKEKEIILEKLTKTYPNFEINFKTEISYMNARIQYEYAILNWKKGNSKAARKCLYPYLNVNKKLLFPYILSFVPYRFYNSLLSLDKRNVYRA